MKGECGYVELHARSAFSFLRGASQPRELAEAGAAVGLEAMAVCDRGGVYGTARFHKAARKQGVRPIVGCELAMEDGCTFPVLIKSRQGYRNLCKLLTQVQLRAEKGQGSVRWEELAEFAEGMIALTGDDEGPLHRAWVEDGRVGVERALGRFRGAFADEDLGIEVQRHHIRGEQRWVLALRDLAESERLQVVATNGVCYATQKGRGVQDIFTCLRKKTNLDEAGSLLSCNAQRFVKSPKEMAYLFQDMREAVSNTFRVAERCEFSLENIGYEFPRFPVPKGESMDSFLKKIVWFGAEQRYGSLSLAVKRQLRHELDVIGKLEFSGYFLIVWDLVNYCREHNIMAQGRGSAANSAVCYSLGITPVDPVGGGLLFERFLNEERRSWPDIDIDLPSGSRREQVIQEVYRRYGRHGAAMTANVITYRGRSAVREIGKVLGFAEETLGRFSSLYESHNYSHEISIEEQFENSEIPVAHPRAAAFARLFPRIVGLPRHLGQHSGGMIICQGELDSLVPLEPASMPGRTVVQWDKEDCEDMGMVKVDLLGLGMMAVMQDAFEAVRAKGRSIDLASIPKDDAATYAMMQKADTIGVFQIESRAQMATLPRMKPKCFYDVVIEVGIIRPGPIQGNMVNPYLERRAGRLKVEYIDDCLKPMLERTLGVALFQEQILKVAMVMANFSGARAEELRRAVSFYRTGDRIGQVMTDLVAAMRERNVAEDKIDQVVKSVSSFAHYGFPESHAISFGLLAYASTYLKAHYAAEFYVSLLNNQPMGFYSPATLIQDAKRHDIRVRAVDVSVSGWLCLVEDERSIRLGLTMVNGVSREHAKVMLDAREAYDFVDLRDFRKRTRFDKDELRTLASVGALNCFEKSRRHALWAVESGYDPDDLFADAADERSLSPLETMTHVERLRADYEGVGVTVGAHPMGAIRDRLKQVWTAGDLEHTLHGNRVIVAGQVICRQRPGTAKGFLFISLEDETGISNIVVMPQMFERSRLTITQEKFLRVSGTLQNFQGVIHVKADKIEVLDLRELPAAKSYDFH
ncbi:MAG: error-prone DNA polymerase [Opitutales bacterium]|nr:error-prone DNA polymerase [Opitutales bacterium]